MCLVSVIAALICFRLLRPVGHPGGLESPGMCVCAYVCLCVFWGWGGDHGWAMCKPPAPGRQLCIVMYSSDILPCCLQGWAAFISMSSQPGSPDSCPWNPGALTSKSSQIAMQGGTEAPSLLLSAWYALLFNYGSEVAAQSLETCSVYIRVVCVSEVCVHRVWLCTTIGCVCGY